MSHAIDRFRKTGGLGETHSSMAEEETSIQCYGKYENDQFDEFFGVGTRM